MNESLNYIAYMNNNKDIKSVDFKIFRVSSNHDFYFCVKYLARVKRWFGLLPANWEWVALSKNVPSNKPGKYSELREKRFKNKESAVAFVTEICNGNIVEEIQHVVEDVCFWN